MIVKLAPEAYRDPLTGRENIYFSPKIDVVIFCNHMSTRSIRCLIDTGATFNLFPAEVATAFLGFSEKTLVKKGREMKFYGIGGIEKTAYGHSCTIHTPEFRLENVFIYFMKDQPYPLLGRIGFMDRFSKIIIDEVGKNLQLIR